MSVKVFLTDMNRKNPIISGLMRPVQMSCGIKSANGDSLVSILRGLTSQSPTGILLSA